MTAELTLPGSLRFGTRGRVDADPRRQILVEGRGLAASRGFWCGAPVLTEEKKTPGKARGRLVGHVDLRFGWQGQPGSVHPREDDAFMGWRDGCVVVEVLRRWSVDHRTAWTLALPSSSDATIAEGRVDPAIAASLAAWADEGGADRGEARAEALLLRHARRHRELEVHPWSSIGVAATVAHVAELARWARLDPEPGDEVRALDEDIRSRRGCGEVWFGVWAPTLAGDWDPRALADRTTSALGLGIVGTGWREIPRVEAMALLVCVLREDMAYDTPLMADPEARSLAERFVALFPEDAQLFTNAVWTDGRISGSYTPVAPSTLEGGVVAVSRGRAGILWVGDED